MDGWMLYHVCALTVNMISILPAGLLYPQLQRCHRSLETILILHQVSSPPAQSHPVREIRWLDKSSITWWLVVSNERATQVSSCKTRLGDGKIFMLEFGRTTWPFTQHLKLAVMNSFGITVLKLSDLVCHCFFKFALELQLLISHLLLDKDWVDKISNLELFLYNA